MVKKGTAVVTGFPALAPKRRSAGMTTSGFVSVIPMRVLIRTTESLQGSFHDFRRRPVRAGDQLEYRRHVLEDRG